MVGSLRADTRGGATSWSITSNTLLFCFSFFPFPSWMQRHYWACFFFANKKYSRLGTALLGMESGHSVAEQRRDSYLSSRVWLRGPAVIVGAGGRVLHRVHRELKR
ncbi:hypothetical protein LZ31DRAFT_79409 [Colletotrichum somersetense]|nr:hypothetical protein LZ31DRAFT_79409 [Colletotrichum somersetense]